jgi:hypothetical protein
MLALFHFLDDLRNEGVRSSGLRDVMTPPLIDDHLRVFPLSACVEHIRSDL